MRCPKCYRRTGWGALTCSHCGMDLTPFHSFDALKREIKIIKEMAENSAAAIEARMNNLQGSLDLFEESLTSMVISEVPPPDKGSLEEPADLQESPEETTGFQAPQKKQPSEPPSTGIPRMSPPPKVPPSSMVSSEVRFGQKWLLIAGIVIMVVGIGYFLKYSFDRNWIGPAGRVALSYLVGMALLAIGERFRKKDFLTFGFYLIGGGLATLYFSTFAANQIYALVSQGVAFLVMIMVTLLAGSLSLLYDNKWLSVLGIIGGFLTPVVLSTGQDMQFVLMTYMTILNLGILAIAFFRQWELLNYLGAMFTWLLFSGWFFQHYNQPKFWSTIVFLNLFFLIHTFVPFVYYFVKERAEPMRGFAITVPNTFIAFGYSFTIIREYASLPMISPVALGYAAVFLGMVSYLYPRLKKNLDVLILLIAKAVLFLVIAVPLLVSDHWITIFWAAQTVALFWAALRLKGRWLYYGAISLLILTIGKFILFDYPMIFSLHEDFYFAGGFSQRLIERWFTSAAILGVLFAPAKMIKRSDRSLDIFESRRGGKKIDSGILMSLFTAVLFIILNLETSAFFHSYARQARFASISVLWALFAIGLMIFGFLCKQNLLRSSSMIIFAATILKVIMVDMSNISTPFRIISFIVLGLMLIGASYLYHRYKDLILKSVEEMKPSKGGAD